MAKSHYDKIAVISGGANGIGQAFAQRLAQDGAHIVIADVASGSDTVKMVEQTGRHAFACKCDVSSEDSVKALADEVTKRFGCCDILINCAGIFPNQPFDQMTFADWRRVQAINLDSVFLMSAAFAPGMKQRRWGRIVNMASSTLGSVVSGFVHYMASKAGIVGITRALASELGASRSTRSRRGSPARPVRSRACRVQAWRAWRTNTPTPPPCRQSSGRKCRPTSWALCRS